MTGSDHARHLAIVGPFPPFRGGIAQFSSELYSNLKRAGHEVCRISFSRQYPEFLFPGKSQLSDADVPSPDIEQMIDSINPLSWRKTARALGNQGVEEVIFMYWMPFFAPAFGCIARALKRRDVRVTAIVHNAQPHERQPFTGALSRYFFSSCDRIITLSTAVKRDIVALGIERDIEIAPHPVYNHFGDPVDRKIAREKLSLGPEENVILFFGLVRKYKGLDILLQALSKCKEKRRLVVAGEWYEEKEYLIDLIEELGIGDQVTIWDNYIPDEDVKTFFSAADVVVQPYRTATQSGVVQTAFHFGRPVIVTGVGGLPEMVRHDVDGFIVAPEESGALAVALDRFFTGDTPARLSAGTSKARERFTWVSFTDLFRKR